ncbi:hypothetical protein BH09PSE3_BH09PSE3_12170 [soil metagenome]
MVLSVGAALALIAAIRPRLLYFYAHVLDLEEITEGAREELGLVDDEKAPMVLTKAINLLKAHKGEICRTAVHFVIDSVYHTATASATWFETFEESLEELVEDAKQEIDDRLRAEGENVSVEIKARAKQLAAEPAFNFGRVSAAKRLVLATAMFPADDEDLLHQVVDTAEKLDWLAQSGYGLST